MAPYQNSPENSVLAQAAVAPRHGEPPAMPFEGFDEDMGTFAGSLFSVEGIAVQFGLMPVELARQTCSVEAESLLRRLGRFPKGEDPWLPVSTLGPLLIFAHCNPKSTECWGVPPFMGVRVVISETAYHDIRKDFVARLNNTPLPAENMLERLSQPLLNPRDLDGAFDWLITHYPFHESEKERLLRHRQDQMDRHGFLGIAEYNAMEPNLGVALDYLTEGPSRLCFNPEDAPRQHMFPVAMLEKHGVFPAFCGTRRVYLLCDGESFYSFEDEWLSSGNDPVEFVPVLADLKEIRKAITRDSNKVAEPAIDTSELSRDYSMIGDLNLVQIDPLDMAEIDPANVNHTPEELMHWVLYTAIAARASDLHIEKFYNLVRFRARIDGKLKVIFSCPEEMLMRFIALIKNYSNMKQSRQDAQDARFAMAIGKRRIDVRVAAVPWRKEHQKLTLRFLDKQDGLKEMAELNLSKQQSAMIKRAMSRDQGMILVTGPTGSGKTTTLYALINSVNEEDINIQTIEDPIEYEIEGINQTQTDSVNGITFASGLRSLLRSDPDVILIGECRDEETATAAVNSALTGHLVLTTLHANDSLRAISRLLSMGVEAHLLSDSLALTQAQRLVRKLCNYCKRPMQAPEALQEMMARQGVISEPLKEPIYGPVGCPECHNTGYSGRIALMELCEITPEISDLIEREAPMNELRAAARRNGFRSLFQEGLIQVLTGRTTMDEIKRVSYTAY